MDGAAAADLRVWLACDGQLLAGYALDDALREGAAQAVRALRDDGLQVLLVSGDAPARAQALGHALGLRQALGGATPEDKLQVVSRLQARGDRVAMVGDGINDAPVLARADVSLAMGQGALVARSQADAVLVSNRLMDHRAGPPQRPPRGGHRAPKHAVGGHLQRAQHPAGLDGADAALGRRAGHGRQFTAGHLHALRAAR